MRTPEPVLLWLAGGVAGDWSHGDPRRDPLFTDLPIQFSVGTCLGNELYCFRTRASYVIFSNPFHSSLFSVYRQGTRGSGDGGVGLGREPGLAGSFHRAACLLCAELCANSILGFHIRCQRTHHASNIAWVPRLLCSHCDLLSFPMGERCVRSSLMEMTPFKHPGEMQ